MTATENGALDLAVDQLKPLRYPSPATDVDYVFLPDDSCPLAHFSSTLSLRLLVKVKFLSVAAGKEISRPLLRKGPTELQRANLCKEIWRRGGLVLVDGALVVENMSTEILDRLCKMVVRYYNLTEREEWTILFREGELKVRKIDEVE